MVTVYEMDYNEDKQVQYVRTDEQVICSVCDCEVLIKKGWRRRTLILINDEELVLMVRRVKCKGCNKTHHVLPDIIVPYKRHDLETIEKIVLHNQNETVCEESVINRIKTWWRRLLLYATMLQSSKQIQFPAPSKPQLSTIVRILVNANLWPGTRIALGFG